MKRIILFFVASLFAVFLSGANPKGLKVPDTAEYGKYLAWCKQTVKVCDYQHGVLTVVKKNGQWTDSIGNFTPKIPKTVRWYRVGFKGPFIAEPNQIHITRVVLVNRQYHANPTVEHFYNWWVKYPALHQL